MAELFEGLWDCSNCLTKGIKGRYKKCPGCGDPRNTTLTPEEDPYLPDGATPITDPAVLAMFGGGPDWNCGHCGEANRGDAKVCANCRQPHDGDDLSGTTATYLSGVSAEGADFSPDGAESADRVERLLPDPVAEADRVISGEADRPRKPRQYVFPGSELNRHGEIATRVEGYERERAAGRNLPSIVWERNRTAVMVAGGVVALAAVVLATVLINRAYFKTEETALRVDALTWSRSVEVEEYRTLVEDDWNLPAGGRLIRSYRAIHHHDREFSHYDMVPKQVSSQVYDGQESYACGSTVTKNGDGSFSRETQYCSRAKYRTEYHTEYEKVARYVDVPVYRTKYEYHIDRWVHSGWVLAEGGAGELGLEPYWPKPEGLAGNQRQGAGKMERYRVGLSAVSGKSFDKELEFDVWRGLKKGQTVTGHISRGGKLRSVDWRQSTRAA